MTGNAEKKYKQPPFCLDLSINSNLTAGLESYLWQNNHIKALTKLLCMNSAAMGNTHSQAAQKLPLCEKEKSTAFLTTEMLLTLFNFSGGLFSALLPPVTSDNSSSSGQYKQRGHL